MKTAVQFGAGKIGRGFLGQLLHASGFEITFVDAQPDLVAALDKQQQYDIRIVGPDAETVRVDHIRARHVSDRLGIAAAVAEATVLSTAVGAHALTEVAVALAPGLRQRRRVKAPPLNILVCENARNAASALSRSVYALLPEQHRDQVMDTTGFVQCVVGRMTPEPDTAELSALTVRTEAYMRLPVDARAIVGEMPLITGAVPEFNFVAEVDRKLYAHNCAHASLGYLGHDAGYVMGHEALRDPVVAALVRGVLGETGEALRLEHGFDSDEHGRYVEDLLRRFSNAELRDTCRRLARDPLRKLAPDDRLIGAARLCNRHGVACEALYTVIAIALRYNDPGDPSAVQLETLREAGGDDLALQMVCGVAPDEPLGEYIRSAAARVDTRRRHAPRST